LIKVENMEELDKYELFVLRVLRKKEIYQDPFANETDLTVVLEKVKISMQGLIRKGYLEFLSNGEIVFLKEI